MRQYVLDANGEPVFEPDFLTWGKWLETANRHVADERIGPYRISTVFLGIDHSFRENGPPILWETMAFRSDIPREEYDNEMDRCAGGREQAEAMHARMVERIKLELAKPPAADSAGK